MTAILRFLWLKSLRDSSLVGFIMVPAMVPLAACVGVTLSKGHFTYPMYLTAQSSAAASAELACTISMAMAVLFGGIASFWALRADIASRSINAFVFGARPAKIALALIVFGTFVAMAGWIGGVATTWMATSSLPPHLPMFILKATLAFTAGSAAGALAVTVSSQPAMIVGTYFASVVVMPFIDKSGTAQQMTIAVVTAIACTVLSAVLLERRCAA